MLCCMAVLNTTLNIPAFGGKLCRKHTVKVSRSGNLNRSQNFAEAATPTVSYRILLESSFRTQKLQTLLPPSLLFRLPPRRVLKSPSGPSWLGELYTCLLPFQKLWREWTQQSENIRMQDASSIIQTKCNVKL